jgi:hypothetical protein
MKLVTFESKAGDFTIFAEIAVALLKLMGHSGTIPGAVLAADVPEALKRLQTSLAAGHAGDVPAPAEGEKRDPNERPVTLGTRAYPLVQLLAKSAKLESDVMWDYHGKALGDYL